MLLFLQSLHQHSSMQEIVDELKRSNTLLNRFYDYKQHVDCECYHDPAAFNAEQDQLESEWPLYKDRAHLLLQPLCSDLPQTEWDRTYTQVVQQTQKLVNHHVHPLDHDTGERTLLPGCRLKARPNECKGRFPREQDVQLLKDKPAIVCPALAKILGVKITGRRSELGKCLGKRNHPSLNGAHKAMLFNLRCNCDTILTWRMPVCEETHTACDDPSCLVEDMLAECSRAVRRAQRDQSGYISDYVAKKMPIAKRETWLIDRSLSQLQQRLLAKRVDKRRSSSDALHAFNHSVLVRMSDALFLLQDGAKVHRPRDDRTLWTGSPSHVDGNDQPAGNAARP